MHAAIDIGTNTVLLLVAEIHRDTIKPIREEQRIPRLGRGVDSSGNLDQGSVDRVIRALNEYRQILENNYPNIDSLKVTATSAVRDAGNREDFIQRVMKETGLGIKVLSGKEEAEYTFTGALSMLSDISKAAIIDIGGGSTEIALGDNNDLIDSHSFDMGSVRFTERYLNNDPPTKKETGICREAIKELLDDRLFDYKDPGKDFPLIGVAGTVTSIAYMDMGLEIYDTQRINGYVMSREQIGQWTDRITDMPAAELLECYPKVMEGRAEVIAAGILILDEFMHYYDIPELRVSTGGIRHGAILQKAAL